MTLTQDCFYITTALDKKSGIEADRVMNTWHYRPPSAIPTSTDLGNWVNNWLAFVNGISSQLGFSIASGANHATVTFWKLPHERGPLGAPWDTLLGAVPVVGFATGMSPAEVSMCLTIQADLTGVPEHGPGGTSPASRRRNRVYLGPIDAGTFVRDSTTQDVYFGAGGMSQILNSYAQHMADDMRADGWHPAVFSRANWEQYPVTQIAVDNAPDTQRRRGVEPTVRTPLTITS